MKVIDLLNKIANGEIPKMIKYDNDIYEYNKDYQDYVYFNTGIDKYITFIEDELNSVFNLNEEVEIIEDTSKEEVQVLSRWYPPKEDKKIEKLKDYSLMRTMGLDGKWQERKITRDITLKEIMTKLNEIIDRLNDNIRS